MTKGLIAKIHIAKKELGLDDGTYRAIIKQATNKESCAKCNAFQLEKVIELMKSKGWKPKTVAAKKKAFRKPPTDLIAKIYAIWGDLQEIGAVSSSDKSALDNFIKKYTKVDSVQWIDDYQAIKIIEMLKQWLKRVSK